MSVLQDFVKMSLCVKLFGKCRVRIQINTNTILIQLICSIDTYITAIWGIENEFSPCLNFRDLAED